MTPIMQALSSGYGEEQILEFISKAAPSLSKQISKARNTGYSVSNILSFLSKTIKDDEFDPYLTQSEAHKKVKEKRERNTKNILKTAASSGALYGAASFLPEAIQGIKGAFTNKSQPTNPSMGPTPMANAPVRLAADSTTEMQQSPPSQIPPQEQQPIAPQSKNQPSGVSPVKVDSQDILKQMGIEGQVKNLSQAGNSTEAIEAAVNMSLRPNQKKWLESQVAEGKAKPLADMIADYVSKEPEKNEEPPKELQKDELVATPSGEVGTIKDRRKNDALVDEDGILHKVKISDLQAPNETVVQTVSRLLEIPEIEKSALINYWAYDPEDKELFLMFHNGETYKYVDVPEELESELSESSISPKTKGQNEFGAWSQEDPNSRGATFIQKLIAHEKYKKSKKGESANPHYRKLRKGYDYWTKLRKG